MPAMRAALMLHISKFPNVQKLHWDKMRLGRSQTQLTFSERQGVVLYRQMGPLRGPSESQSTRRAVQLLSSESDAHMWRSRSWIMDKHRRIPLDDVVLNLMNQTSRDRKQQQSLC